MLSCRCRALMDWDRLMSLAWQRRLILDLAVVLLAVSCLNIALPTAAQTPARVSLAGQLLVATPAMGDPRFDRTVIVMVRHSRDGAFGIVINRPIGEHSLS